MAKPYYRFFPGDYARDTGHLSMLQDGAYHRLINLYMDRGGPLPHDLDRICRWVRVNTPEDRAAVEFVLAEFFKLSTDGDELSTGWKHKRCDAELIWRNRKVEKAIESAKKRWECERNANAMRTQSDGNAIQNQSNSKAARAKFSPLAWFATEAGVLRKGNEFGMSPRPGESLDQFKGRVDLKLQGNG